MKPGTIVSFQADPASMALLVPTAGSVRFCGEVIETKPIVPFGPGKIPNVCCKVRGKTGKEVSIDFVGLFGAVHESWKEAEASVKEANRKKKP